MRMIKRGTALLLAAAMAVSLLPLSALAEEAPEADSFRAADEVRFNTSCQEIAVGSDVERAQAGEEPYVLFEEDGSYTIELYEPEPFFPYEVQFISGGETTTAWFMDEGDSVEVGGHKFYVSCLNGTANRIGFYVGGEYVAAYPEEKEFTNGGGEDPASLLPLEEKNLTLNLTGRLPGELAKTQLSTVLTGGGISANDSAVMWTTYDNEYEANKDYTVIPKEEAANAIIDLTPKSRYNDQLILELVIGGVDQLDTTNKRYIVTVNVSYFDDPFEFEALGGVKSYYCYRSTLNGQSTYTLEVDGNTWDGKSKFAVSMSLRPSFNAVFNRQNDLSIKVYEGFYETEIPNGAKEITAELYGFPDKPATGYEGVFSSNQDVSKFPAATVVFQRNGQDIDVMPFLIHAYATSDMPDLEGIYKEENGNYSHRVANYIGQERETGVEKYQMISEQYDASGTYYVRARYLHQGKSVDPSKISEYVKKTVVGSYKTAAEVTGEDITNQLFGGGHLTDLSKGIVTFTVVDKNDRIFHMSFRTISYDAEAVLPPAPAPLSEDTYFRIEGAGKLDSQGQYTAYDAYVMPYGDDGYYYNGYQTVFLLNNSTSSPVDKAALIPQFYTGNKVQMYRGHDNLSGEIQINKVTPVGDMEFGKPLAYSAGSESRTHLKNYWVTFVTQDTTGPKLFVNGATNADVNHLDEASGLPRREVFLDEGHGNHHDVFIANIGNQPLTDLSVSLESPQNVKLDEYWMIGTTKELAAFTTTEKDPDKPNGELPNVAKIRLVPDGDKAGDISGILVIRAGGEEVKIKLTGTANAPKITTEKLLDGVKYVPYSSVIQTNNMYRADGVTFRLTGGTLPNGVVLKQNGEIYGTPTLSGSFSITVTISYDGKDCDTKEFTLNIADNSDRNVWLASDSGYSIVSDDGTVGVPSGKVDNDETTWYHQVLDQPKEQLFWSAGPYRYFVDFWLDGHRLKEGVDYQSDAGSTKITIYAQTFQNAGSGTHTIAAEFREGSQSDGTLKRTSQNYTLPSSGSDGSDGSSGSSGSGGSSGGSSTSSAKPKPNENKPVEEPDSVFPFTDVQPPHWFYDDVKWAYENKYMVGISEALFAPFDPITQGTVVTVLARMGRVDLEQFDGESYSNIESGQWYTNAAIWATQSGILPDNSTFREHGGSSRGQMAIMLVKYLTSLGVDTSLPQTLVSFADGGQMTQEENHAFQVLYHYGIFRGIGGYYMNAAGTTSRAEFSALIHRMSTLLDDRR